jgi:hypothetical protein
MIAAFTPFPWLFGGILIGLGAVILMALNGRIAGMKAMLCGVLNPQDPDNPWLLPRRRNPRASPCTMAHRPVPDLDGQRHLDGPNGHEIRWDTAVAKQRAHNIHLRDGINGKRPA